MGLILGEQGEFEEAVRVFRRGIAAKERMLAREDEGVRGFSEFQLSRIWTHLARVLHRAGRLVEATGAVVNARRYIQGRIDVFATKGELIPEDYLDTRGRIAVLEGLVAKDEGDIERAKRSFGEALDDYDRIGRQGVACPPFLGPRIMGIYPFVCSGDASPAASSIGMYITQVAENSMGVM